MSLWVSKRLSSVVHLGAWGRGALRPLFVVVALFAFVGCGLLKKKPPQTEKPLPVPGVNSKPLPPEEAKGVLNEMGKNWLYGPGLGKTALNVGAIAAFPPYALYLLGNGVLSLSGYEKVEVTSVLPENGKKNWDEFYHSVSSGPGRVSAAIAGKEFRTDEIAKKRLKERLEKHGEDRSRPAPKYYGSERPGQ